VFFFSCFCQRNVNLIKKHLKNFRLGGAFGILKIPVGIDNATKLIKFSKPPYQGWGGVFLL
jgi:hypothetical protein